MPVLKLRPLILAAVSLAIVAGLLWGGYGIVQWRARSAVEEALASLPPDIKGTVGRTHYRLFSSVLEIDGIALTRAGNPWLAAEHATLDEPGGKGTAHDPWHAAKVSLTGFAGQDASVPQRLDSLTVIGPVLESVDPGSGSGVTLRRADKVVLDGLAASGASLQHLDLAGFADGRAADLALAGLVLKEADLTTSIAAVTLKNVDLAGLSALFGAPGPSLAGLDLPRLQAPPSASPAARGDLIGALSARGLVTERTGGGTDRIGTLELSGMAAAQPTADLGWPEALAGSKLVSLHIQDLDLTETSAGPTDDHGHLTIKSLALSDYDAGKAGSLDLKGLAFEDQAAADRLELARMQLRDVDATALVTLLGTQPDADIDHLLTGARIGRGDLEGFAYRVAPTDPPLSFDSLQSQNEYAADGSVRSIVAICRLSLGPLIGDAGALPPIVGELLKGETAADLNVNYLFTPADRELDLDQLKITVPDLGALTLQSRLTGLALDEFDALSANPMLMGLALLGKITIVNASLRLDDHSLMNRIIAQAARDTGLHPDEVRQGIRRQLPVLADYMPWQEDVVDQAEAFLDHPRSLTLTLSPSEPVTLLDLGSDVLNGSLDLLQPRLHAN